MGDRANIVMNQHSDAAEKAGTKPQRIYFYTHGNGFELPVVLQRALVTAKGSPSGYPSSRWRDESYLGRIIFSEMTKDAYSATTGYGISTYHTDGGYHLLVVDSDKQTVHLEKAFSDDRVVTHGPWTFEQYIAMNLEEDNRSAWKILRGEAPEEDEG